MGIPDVPPVGTVRISPLLNEYPKLFNSKPITLDPCPTTMFIFASVPTPDEDDEYTSGILL